MSIILTIFFSRMQARNFKVGQLATQPWKVSEYETDGCDSDNGDNLQHARGLNGLIFHHAKKRSSDRMTHYLVLAYANMIYSCLYFEYFGLVKTGCSHAASHGSLKTGCLSLDAMDVYYLPKE